MTEAVDAFVGRLFAAVPQLRQDWERYLRSHQDNEARGLQPPGIGVFLQELADNAQAWFRSGDPMLTAQLDSLLEFFESQLGVDPEIDELIETKFTVFLPEPGDPAEGLLGRLGSKLRAARLRQFREDEASVPPSTVAFLHRLDEKVPQLRARVRQHFEEHRGRPLPHAFVGEIVFEAVGLVSSGRTEVVQPLLVFLESEFGSDEDIDNVIAVSFVEMLPNPGEPGAEIVDLLGPRLRGEYERQLNQRL